MTFRRARRAFSMLAHRSVEPSAARRVARALAAALALLASLLGHAPAAEAQPARMEYCRQIQAQLAALGRGGGDARRAAQGQRALAEAAQLRGRASALRCGSFSSIFNGESPECRPLLGRIAQLEAEGRQLASDSDGQRRQLAALYNQNCTVAAAQPQPRSLLDAIFGPPRGGTGFNVPPADVPDLRRNDLDADEPGDGLDDTGDEGERRYGLGGSFATICVRACDGYYFPVSASASQSTLGRDQERCQALCPAAEVQVYGIRPGAEAETAVNGEGARLADHPNAFRYRKTFDPSCSCRRPGQSWAEALRDADATLGTERSTDITVTPQKADELARPRPVAPAETPRDRRQQAARTGGRATTAVPPAPGSPAAPPMGAGVPPVAGAAMPLRAPGAAPDAAAVEELAQAGRSAPTASGEASGIAEQAAPKPENYAAGQGATREVTGPDGVKRRVRVVGPTLYPAAR